MLNFRYSLSQKIIAMKLLFSSVVVQRDPRTNPHEPQFRLQQKWLKVSQRDPTFIRLPQIIHTFF